MFLAVPRTKYLFLHNLKGYSIEKEKIDLKTQSKIGTDYGEEEKMTDEDFLC